MNETKDIFTMSQAEAEVELDWPTVLEASEDD